jgi:hypothetical protein
MNKIYKVTWEDATCYSGWTCPNSIDYDLVQCETVGYLLSKNKEKIVLSMTKGIESVAEVMVIPTKWCKEIKEIK